MSLSVIKKYRVNTNLFSSNKTNKSKSFWDLAKKHIVTSTGKKEDLALNLDKILYGKK